MVAQSEIFMLLAIPANLHTRKLHHVVALTGWLYEVQNFHISTFMFKLLSSGSFKYQYWLFLFILKFIPILFRMDGVQLTYLVIFFSVLNFDSVHPLLLVYPFERQAFWNGRSTTYISGDFFSLSSILKLCTRCYL